MIYLSGTPLRALATTRVGVMLTPNIPDTRVDIGKMWWAADTGLFSEKGARAFDLTKYLGWLDARLRFRPTCLFATAPDVVGNWDATLSASLPVLPLLRAKGWLAALVDQDGLTLDTVPWGAFDVLFIGGTDRFKLSESTYELVKEAEARNVWTHCGRVNSYRRLKAMAHAGVNSADGTFLKFGPDINMPRMLKWLYLLDAQPKLEVA